MCVVKTPKITNPTPATAAQDKPLPIIRNPLLDGIDAYGGLKIGPKSLRIDRSPTAATAPSKSVPSSLLIQSN